jgi:predicted permease
VDTILSDVRYAVRRLMRQRGFTAIALLSLALGIGVNTAIFTLVNALLLGDSGVEAPAELVNVYLSQPEFPTSVFSYPEYRELVAGTEAAFTGVVGSQLTLAQRDAGDRVEPLMAEIVTGNYFEVLGVRAAAGRLLSPTDDAVRGGHPVVVLGHGYWTSAFDRDPSVVGRELRLNGVSYTVIGVTPASYEGNLQGLAPAVYFPFAMVNQVIRDGDDYFETWGNHSIFVKARLRPGVSLAQAEAAVAAVDADLDARGLRQWPEANEIRLYATTDVILFPPMDRVIVPAAGLLTAVVALVLLIACANLASFLLARARDRRKEVAIRLALGAGRGRLIRQLLTETTMLALLGGALGVLLSVVLLRLLLTADLPLPLPITLDVAPDRTVLAFTALLSLAAGVLFGLAPALQSTNPDVAPTLKDETTGEPPRRFTLRRVLVVGQVAVSLVLMVVAGLFIRSFQARQQVDPGFGQQPAAVVSFGVPSERYPEGGTLLLLDRLRTRIGALPGVASVGLTSNLHLNPLNNQSRGLNVDGIAPPPGQTSHGIDISVVDGGFFDAAGVRLLRGRPFAATDDADAPLVVIVNEAFAQRFWPGEDALGRVVRSSAGVATVIGVAADAKIRQLGEAPRAFAYLPMAQNETSFVTLVARTQGPADVVLPRVLEEIRALDRDIVLFETKTMARHLAAMLLPARLGAIVIAGFAALALTLALVGLYGVVSYAVASRTREVGIRMSFGASAGEMVQMLTAAGLRLVLIGAALGVVLALAGGQVLSSLLFGVAAVDPITFVGVPVLFVCVSAIAAYLPARRASRIDPVRALRGE